MGFVELFVAASVPVLKVLIITALGSYLALDRVNILGEDARKHLNAVVFFVFSPALVGSNLAQTITYDSMLKLWFMPFNILITFIIGSFLGWLVILFTRPASHMRGLILGCCAAGNLGNMLLILIPAVCKEKGSPFGDPDACRAYGMAYVSLSMAVGAIYLWSYVYNLVRVLSSRNIKESNMIDSFNGKSSREISTVNLGSSSEPLLSSKDSEDREDQYALPCTIHEGKVEVTVSGKMKQCSRSLCGGISLETLFAPSTTAAIVGFIIGLTPQLRKLLIGDDALLHVIQDSAFILGNGAIPALTLILGGNLLRGLRESGIQKSIVVGIVVARYVALPLIGIFIVKGAERFGLVNPDPLYKFFLLIQFAVPPAMNIGTMTQLFGAGESECSIIMLWTYTLASISITLWSTFFMWLVA